MIDWSGAIWAGIWGGLAMEASAVLFCLLGFGKNSMDSYEGCMLTGRGSGAESYLASMIIHLALSAMVVGQSLV